MAAKLFTTEEQLLSTVTAGIKARFETNIKKKLHEIVDPQIAEIAKETAEEIVSKIVAMNDQLTDRILLTVIFNEKRMK